MSERKAEFVAAMVCKVPPSELDRVAEKVAEFARRHAALIPGLIEAAILRGEKNEQLLLLSQWENRDAWARAQWDGEVGRIIGDLAQSGSVDIRSFQPIAIIRPD